MKTKLAHLALVLALTVPAFAQENKESSTFTPAQLNERTVHRRAVEAVIWGMPAVNMELLFQAVKGAKADFSQVVYWSRLPDWKNQTLTPNPDTVYLFPFFNTKEAGPMVLEVPPADEGSITGSIDDAWQVALEDVGPAGVDKGKGGKYLILPPGYKDKTPEGYIALPSATYTGFVALRSTLPRLSRTGSGRSFTRSHKRPILRQQSSSTLSTSYSITRSPTTCDSFKRLIASYSESHGWNATRQ